MVNEKPDRKHEEDSEYEEKNKIIAYCVRKGFSLSDVIKATKEMI